MIPQSKRPVVEVYIDGVLRHGWTLTFEGQGFASEEERAAAAVLTAELKNGGTHHIYMTSDGTPA